MAEALTIALILEARDNASEWIDRVRENVEKLAQRAEEASKEVSDSADQMSASLEKTDAASTSAAESMDRESVASTEAAASMRDTAMASDEATVATDKQAESTTVLGDKSEESAGKMGLMSKASSALGLALVGVAVVATKMAIDFQNSTATLAGQAGISTAAANKIGQAFLAAGGQTTFTANEMMTAFSPVAGEFVNMYGHALNAAGSMKVMNAAMTLAEAGGGDLTTTTKALADAMMVFHLKVGQAASAANTMFNTSRLLGVSTDSLGQSLQRLEPRIAGSGMSLSQTSAFMIELSKVAGGGRQAMRIAGQSIQSLVSPSTTAQKTLGELGITLTNSKGKFIGMTSAIAQIHDALAKLPGTTKDVSALQKMYRLQTEETTLALGPQNKAIKSQITALSSQITALGGSTKALSNSSVMQAIFGKSAGLMANIVAGGVPMFNKATAAVTKQGEASKAAAEKQATFEGELKKLKSAAESIFIELGQKLLPVLTKMAKDTVSIVNHIITWVEHNKTLATVLAVVAVAILVVVEALKAWAAVQKLLDVLELTSGLGLIVLAIAAVVAALVVAIVYWKDIKRWAVDAWHGIEDAWDVVSSWFDTNVIEPVVGFFRELWTGVSTAASAAWTDITGVWTAVSTWFDTNVIEPVVGFFMTLWNDVYNFADASWGLVKAVWNLVGTWFNTNVVTPVSRFFSGLWHGISDAASTAWHAIVTVWDAVASWFNTNVIQPNEKVFGALWTALTTGFQDAWNAVLAVWNAVSSWFNTNVIQPVEKFFSSLWNDLVNGAKKAVGLIEAPFKAVGGFFSDIWNGITGGVKAVIHGISGATQTVKGLTKAVNDTNSAMQNAAKSSSKLTSAKGLTNVHIRKFAEGGIVSSPTLGIVGEAGPEMVIPLSQLPDGATTGGVTPLPTSASGQGGGSTIVQVNLTMSGQVYGDINAALNAMGRQLATILVPGAGTRLTTR